MTFTTGSKANLVLTQSFETSHGDGWSIALGANSSYQHINNGTAADGDYHVRFTLGQNLVDENDNLVQYASASVFGQWVWDDSIRLSEVASTMQVRGEFSSYMVYQVVPDPNDLSNQIFIVGGSLLSPLSLTNWSTWSAGQDDPFHAAAYLGGLYQLPPATVSSRLLLSELSGLPILLAADGSDTGRVWGDAQVRWVSPQAGFGSGYDPARFTDLDLLEVTVIPEPTSLALLGLALGAVAARQRLRGRR